jgi:hypothetical protein
MDQTLVEHPSIACPRAHACEKDVNAHLRAIETASPTLQEAENAIQEVDIARVLLQHGHEHIIVLGVRHIP